MQQSDFVIKVRNRKHIRVKDRAEINRVVREASKIIGKTQKPLSEVHGNFVKKKAKKILKDRTHPPSTSHN